VRASVHGCRHASHRPVHSSSPEAQAALATAGEAFASSDVEEASANISDYMDEVCED
jgi:hypothetical protein